VRFSPIRYENSSARGIYAIVSRLPVEDNMLRYLIKSSADGHERIAREDQLELVI
jgi:hypothetical protein